MKNNLSKTLIRTKSIVGSILLIGVLAGCGNESSKASSTTSKATSAICQGEKIQSAIIESFIDETFRRIGQEDDEEMRKGLRSTLSNGMKISLANAKVLKADSGTTTCQAQFTMVIKPNPKAPEIKKVLDNVIYRVLSKNNKTTVEFDDDFWQNVDTP